MLKRASNNIQKITILIVGIIIGSSIGVYSASMINSNIVLYNNDKTDVSNVKEALDELFLKANNKVLADVVNIGDYVAYDAGSWTETVAKPTSQGNFGGYTADQNKANSVTCNNPTTLKGWRVLRVDTSANTVTIIHAGQPECYYHGTDSTSSVTNLNNRAASEYINSDYADNAHMLTYDEAVAITGSTGDTANTLRRTESHYWLASPSSTNYLYGAHTIGSISSTYGSNFSFGVRPVIVLKPNIRTKGKTIDTVGQDAWSLVAS